MRRASPATGPAAASRSHFGCADQRRAPWRCRCGRACTGRRTRARRSASGCAPRPTARVVVGQHDHRGRADEAAVAAAACRSRAACRPATPAGCRPRRRPAGSRRSGGPASMPPQYSSISSCSVMPAGASLTPGSLDAARHRERAQALAAVPAVRGEPVAALLEDLAHPVQRLEVVLQRRPAEQADLRDVRRAQPRHAALAFDRFDHRRLFAADVGAGAAPQDDLAAAPATGGSARSAASSASSIARQPWYSSRR